MVEEVLSAVCLLFSLPVGNWEQSQNLLGDRELLKKIQNYDKDNIPEEMLIEVK